MSYKSTEQKCIAWFELIHLEFRSKSLSLLKAVLEGYWFDNEK